MSFQKELELSKKYSPIELTTWFNKFLDFIKNETDMEFEILPTSCDQGIFNGSFFDQIKHKKGKIIFINLTLRLWRLMHEFGHLASIPKQFRSKFNSSFETRPVSINNPLYNITFGPTGYAADEELAQYWSYFVAKKLEIPTEMFGYLFAEPMDEKEYFNHIRYRPFYAARQTGFAKIFGELLKYNS